MSKVNRIKNRQIIEEASHWAVTLDAGKLTADQKRQLADWLLESPRHVEELLMSTSLFDAFETVDRKKSRIIETILAEASSQIIPLIPEEQLFQNKECKNTPEGAAPRNVKTLITPHNKVSWLPWGGIAAVFLAVFVWMNNIVAPPSQKITNTNNKFVSDESSGFSTQLGEQRKMVLTDGSVIHVNTQSEVAIRFTENLRTVELFRGEALFEVVHNPNRPFRVVAGDTVTEAIGTTFNVYKTKTQTTIAVIEGKVAVDPTESNTEPPTVDYDTDVIIDQVDDGRILLTAGQKADIAPLEETVRVAMANIKAVSSWRVGQLIFEGDRLDDIVEQFNRYNHVNIAIEGKQLAETEFSGVFDADDPNSLIEFLEFTNQVKVDRRDSNFIKISTQ